MSVAAAMVHLEAADLRSTRLLAPVDTASSAATDACLLLRAAVALCRRQPWRRVKKIFSKCSPGKEAVGDEPELVCLTGTPFDLSAAEDGSGRFGPSSAPGAGADCAAALRAAPWEVETRGQSLADCREVSFGAGHGQWDGCC